MCVCARERESEIKGMRALVRARERVFVLECVCETERPKVRERRIVSVRASVMTSE